MSHVSLAPRICGAVNVVHLHRLLMLLLLCSFYAALRERYLSLSLTLWLNLI